MQNNAYDMLIVGGGVAGLTAGLYACRAGLKTALLERMMTGGQVINAEKIENFPGFPDGISGAEIGPLLQDQATRYGLEIQLAEVEGLRQEGPLWAVQSYAGEMLSKAVIIAGGSTLRKLGVPGEEELHGMGVSYCATCDGGFFTEQEVAVIGGGDSALDEALVLTEFASKVLVFHRRDSFRGQKVLQERVLSDPKIQVRWNTTVDAILGKGQVEGISVTDVASGETSRVDLSGIFIYVGLEPNTQYLKDLLSLDNAGHIPTDISMRTPLPGLLAAGDIRQHSAAQLVTAAGDGATAAIAAQRYIESKEGSKVE
jgi:thioredoxin reductase (NADPH)